MVFHTAQWDSQQECPGFKSQSSLRGVCVLHVFVIYKFPIKHDYILPPSYITTGHSGDMLTVICILGFKVKAAMCRIFMWSSHILNHSNDRYLFVEILSQLGCQHKTGRLGSQRSFWPLVVLWSCFSMSECLFCLSCVSCVFTVMVWLLS